MGIFDIFKNVYASDLPEGQRDKIFALRRTCEMDENTKKNADLIYKVFLNKYGLKSCLELPNYLTGLKHIRDTYAKLFKDMTVNGQTALF